MLDQHNPPPHRAATTSLAAAAPQYGQHGVCVFPLARDSKVPLVSKEQGGHGFLDATADVERIKQTWTAHPDANIGCWPGRSGLIAFDMDTPAAEQAARTCGLLAEPGPVVRTPHGKHLYFQRPPERCGNVWVHGVLLARCDDGYTVLPPSRVDGADYRWIGKFDELKPLPPDVVALLRNGNGRHAPLELPAVIPKGRRNDLLFRRGCAMRGQGFSAAAILAAIAVENASRCKPPLEPDELEKIIASIARYPAGPEERSA